MSKVYLTITLLMLSLVPAEASTRYEGYPGAYLRFGAGARDLAMDKAFVAIADDATAVYWNPAGLTRIQGAEFTGLFCSIV